MSHYQARRSPRSINEAAVRQYLHGSVDSLVRYELLLLQYIQDPNPAVLVNVVYGNYRGGLQLREPQKAREKQWRSCQEIVTLLPEISHPSDALCRYQQSFGQRHHETRSWPSSIVSLHGISGYANDWYGRCIFFPKSSQDKCHLRDCCFHFCSTAPLSPFRSQSCTCCSPPLHSNGLGT